MPRPLASTIACLFGLCCFALPLRALAAEFQGELLLLELEALGVSEKEAGLAGEQIAAAMAAVEGVQVRTPAELKELGRLDELKRRLDCDAALGCATELSQAFQIRHAVYGSLGRIGEGYVLALHLVDSEQALALGSSARELANIAALVPALPGMVDELLGLADASPGRFRLSGAALSLAVFDLEASGVSADTARNLTQVLAARLKQLEGTSVISRDDIASMLSLEAQRQQIDCKADAVCLAEIGGALGVQKLVSGTVGRLAKRFVIALRLIDVRRARVDNRIVETYEGIDEQLVPAVRRAARRLLGLSDSGPGSLAVTGSPDGAMVTLDGQPKGPLPLPPLAQLPPGIHDLRLSHEGYFDWRSEVVVEPESTNAVWAELRRVPPPWYTRWWVWAAVGAVVAGGVTAAVVGSAQDGGSNTQRVAATAPPLP